MWRTTEILAVEDITINIMGISIGIDTIFPRTWIQYIDLWVKDAENHFIIIIHMSMDTHLTPINLWKTEIL